MLRNYNTGLGISKTGLFTLPGAPGTTTPLVCAKFNADGTCVEAHGLDPYNPPLQNTRFMIRAMADLNRIFVQQRASAVRKTLSGGLLQTCIGNKSAADPAVIAACLKPLNSEQLLNPLGIINVLGVPFTVDELAAVGEDGKLEKSYVPNGQQHFEADVNVYAMSQFELIKALKVDLSDAALNNFEDIIADFDPVTHSFMPDEKDRIAKGMLGIVSRTSMSVNQATANGFFVTHLDGFSINPIEPLPEELTESNGLFNYYNRGGFILSKPVFTGQEYIIKLPLNVNVGYFQCLDGNISIATEKIPDEGDGWLVFVSVGPAYTIRVQMKDRSSWDSIKNGVMAVLSKIKGLFCKAQPLAAVVAQATLLTETCVREGGVTEATKKAAGCTQLEINAAPGTPPFNSCATKMTCKKGDKGCICTPPSPQSKEALAIAASNALFTKICGAATAAPSCSDLLTPVFPAGSLAFFDTKRNQWWVAVPKTLTVAGFGLASLGATHDLIVSPIDGLVTTPPTGTSATDKVIFCSATGRLGPCKSIFQSPLFWGVVLGVAAVGGGGYYYYKKKHPASFGRQRRLGSITQRRLATK